MDKNQWNWCWFDLVVCAVLYSVISCSTMLHIHQLNTINFPTRSLHPSLAALHISSNIIIIRGSWIKVKMFSTTLMWGERTLLWWLCDVRVLPSSPPHTSLLASVLSLPLLEGRLIMVWGREVQTTQMNWWGILQWDVSGFVDSRFQSWFHFLFNYLLFPADNLPVPCINCILQNNPSRKNNSVSTGSLQSTIIHR